MSDNHRPKRKGKQSHQRMKQRTTAPASGATSMPLPRPRTINHEKMGIYLAAAAKLTDDIIKDRANLCKSESNLQEIVHLLNTGTDPASILNLIESSVQQHLAAITKANESLNDLNEFKAAAKEVLGFGTKPRTT